MALAAVYYHSTQQAPLKLPQTALKQAKTGINNCASTRFLHQKYKPFC